MKRVTIKDVAREAGVSYSAVSRAFTEGASIAPETRARIEAAAKALNYRPSLLARGLVQSRSNIVTLVCGSMADPFDALFMEALAGAMAQVGKRLMLVPASVYADDGSALLQALDDQADAAVVSAGTVSLETAELCVHAGLPVVLAGRVLDQDGIDSVVAENADGGRQAADLFLRTGCLRPAYLGQARETFSDRERGDGFCDAVRSGGQVAQRHRLDGADDAAIYQTALRILSAPDAPDAVFCATDRIAIGVIEAARALGLAIPSALSVIGFNNIPAAARRSFGLTTVDYPVDRVVTEIMMLLDRRLGEPAVRASTRRIPVGLVVRDTTRRVDA
ncbi:MAG: LacI family DNA-binding transcriptional regulator [Pseudomonadota bacterium]